MGDLNIYKTYAYVDSQNLDIKQLTHARYSSKPIDLDGEVIKRLFLRGDESILDLGCGTGDLLIRLCEQENHRGALYGLDITKGVFRRASTLSKERNLNILFQVGNAELLPYPDNSFDVIMARHMLCHVKSIDCVCLEIKRVLRSSGTFVTTANSLRSYPHVRRYRNRVASEVMRTAVSYTSDKFNVENLEGVLKSHFRQIDVDILEGELEFYEIDPFLRYFASTRDVWEPRPNDEQWRVALQLVHKWSADDLVTEGMMSEPKWVAIAVCQGGAE